LNLTYLPFEKPLLELSTRIQALKDLPNSTEYTSEIVRLEKTAKKLKEQLYTSLTPYQKVQIARHVKRPYTLDYISLWKADFIELHGDRYFKDDHSVVAGLADINGYRLMLIGQQKGRSLQERSFRNFGMLQPEGYRKALRLMKLAERMRLPVLTLVDTPGAYPGIGAEERGQAEAIAVNLREMALLKVPIVVAVIGEGGSGGALGIGVGNRILMLEHSIYSVISPEGCAAILFRDQAKAEDSANALQLTAQSLHKLGVIDEIIPEPLGGAHYDWEKTAEALKKAILKNLKHLEKYDGQTLSKQRVDKFLSMGVYSESFL